MNMYFYRVKFYDEITNEDEKVNCGIVCGNTWAEATSNITDYYGKDCVYELSLEMSCYDGGLMPMTEEQVEYLRGEQIW